MEFANVFHRQRFALYGTCIRITIKEEKVYKFCKLNAFDSAAVQCVVREISHTYIALTVLLDHGQFRQPVDSYSVLYMLDDTKRLTIHA